MTDLLLNQDFMSSNILFLYHRKFPGDIDSENAIDKCNCWPQCTQLSFETDITYSNLDAVEYYIGDF